MGKTKRINEMLNNTLQMLQVKKSSENKLLKTIAECGQKRMFADEEFDLQITIKVPHGKIVMWTEHGHTGGTPPEFSFVTPKGGLYPLQFDGKWRV